MKHREKLRMARKNMTQEEIKKGVSPFDSKWWNERKEARKKQHEAKNQGEHERAVKKKELLNSNKQL